MRCPSCDGRGWIEGAHAGGNTFTPSLEQCPRRCDITAYSNEVMKRLNNPAHVTERPVLPIVQSSPSVCSVLQFRKRRDGSA